MVTFTLLVIAALILLVLTVGVVMLGGATILVVFGDVIVGVLIIWFIVKQILKRRNF